MQLRKLGAFGLEADSIKAQKQELSDNIVRLREKFEEE